MSARSHQHPAADDVAPEWIEGHLATVFSRWHPQMARLLQATSDAIVAAEIEPGDAVLDIGSGSGVPALALAAVVGSGGRLAGIEPSPIFLVALAENVRTAGLGNVEVVKAAPDRFRDSYTVRMPVRVVVASCAA